jgi:hypothetical protein
MTGSSGRGDGEPGFGAAERDVLTGLLLDNIEELQREVVALRGDVDALGAVAQSAHVGVWWWPALGPDQARDAWQLLTEWLQDVLTLRYPAADRVLQPCWYRHPDAVDALTVLQATWRAAYLGSAEASAAAQWLHQWLPAGIEQLKQALDRCDRNEHVDDSGRRADIARLFSDDLVAYIDDDIAARVTPEA